MISEKSWAKQTTYSIHMKQPGKAREVKHGQSWPGTGNGSGDWLKWALGMSLG